MTGFWRSAVLLLWLPAVLAENLVRVSGLDSLQLAAEALGSGSPVLFEKVDLEQVRRVVDMSGFVAMPDERREMLFMHKAVHPLTGNKIWRTRDLSTFEVTDSTIYSDNGESKNLTVAREPVSDESRSQFLEDAEEYSQYCGSLQTVVQYAVCDKYLANWRLRNDLPKDDEGGMIPSDHSSVYGQIDQISYISSTTFGLQTMVPSTMWVYAIANAATMQLQNLVAYVIAPGIHTVTPKCNSGGCRAYFKRQLWSKIGGAPVAAHNIYSFHWLFSKPTTPNTDHSVTTSWTESFTLGITATITEEFALFTFSEETTFTASYNEKTQTPDFSVSENTKGTVGSWNYYETYPVDIHKHPVANFASDWETWYSVNWCQAVSGPALAYSAHHTNNAIKWYLAPSLIDYSTKTLKFKYYVQIDAEMVGIWCNDWSGNPANPCNVNGEHHHCASDKILKAHPTWTVNLLKSLNNVN